MNNNNTNKIILPLYLQKEIIIYVSLFINNIKYKCYYEPYNIKLKEELYINKNEILNYYLVSHYWFNSIKLNINYSINFNYINNISINNKKDSIYKILPIKENIKTIYITQYNDNFLNYIINSIQNNKNQTLVSKFINLEKIIILKCFFINNCQSDEFKNYIWDYLIDSLCGLNVEIHISINPDIIKLPFSNCKFKCVDYLDIDSNSYHSRDTFRYIRYLKPRKLKLYERNFDDIELDQHFHYYKELFDTSNLISKSFSENIKSIHLIDIINIEELYHILVNTLNNLKSLKVSLCFETIVYNLSNKLLHKHNNLNMEQDQMYTLMGEVDNFYYYYDQVHSLIVNHLNIKYLTIESKCREFNCNHYVQQIQSSNTDNGNTYYNYDNSLLYYYQQYHQKEFNENFLINFGSMISDNKSLNQFKFIEENNWKLQLYNYIKTNNKYNKDLILK